MANRHEKLAFRLVGILTKLNLGERLDAHQLAEEFNIDVRTIQRDLNERFGFLMWNEQGPRYYSLDKAKLGHLYPEDIQRFAHFCSIQDLLPEIDRRFYQKHLTQSVQVKGFQYENIQHKQSEFDLIHQAIESQNRLEFNYRKNNEEQGKYYTLEPYALLNRNGIWYVIGVDCAAGKQKTFCFTQMNSVCRLPEQFEHSPELLAAIRENDSIYHGNQLAEIVIKVNANVASYFLRRNLFPNQETLHKLENGDLLLKCTNVNEMEIVPIVQYWIPNAVIVSPAQLQQKMEQQLHNYLAK